LHRERKFDAAVIEKGFMENSITYLIASHSKGIIRYIKDILNEKEDSVFEAYSKSKAKSLIQNKEIGFLVCDASPPHREDGLEIIHFFKQTSVRGKALGISTEHDFETVVAIMKSGADDFLPLQSTKDQINKKINSLKKTIIELDIPFSEQSTIYREGVLTGSSPALQTVFQKIRAIAEHEVESCLICGENGTGKELVARTIHQWSARKDNPFVALNCAGLAENLIDSELFGFERGSFTGAYSTTIGKVELAEKGVLFLDEISEMPIQLQAKLLRLLENREIIRIGGRKTIPVDVMIVASTNRDLQEEIKKGAFREDVYHRLNMAKIELPPLRNRQKDIPFLVEHFFKHYCTKLGKKHQLAEDALKAFSEYHFPGNVRELRNIIHNAILFSTNGTLNQENFKQYFSAYSNEESESLPAFKGRVVDKETIQKVLKETNNNITQAAKILGYTREGLSKKLKRMKPKKKKFE